MLFQLPVPGSVPSHQPAILLMHFQVKVSPTCPLHCHQACVQGSTTTEPTS
jgi:hypothetical protein